MRWLTARLWSAAVASYERAYTRRAGTRIRKLNGSPRPAHTVNRNLKAKSQARRVVTVPPPGPDLNTHGPDLRKLTVPEPV